VKTTHKTWPARVPPVDILAPDAVEQFRRAAAVFTANILQSPNPQRAARRQLVKDGILTRTGRLTKNYR